MGNRLEVIKGHVQFPEDTDDSWDHFDYKMTTIKIHVKHWKNDRYHVTYVIYFYIHLFYLVAQCFNIHPYSCIKTLH